MAAGLAPGALLVKSGWPRTKEALAAAPVGTVLKPSTRCLPESAWYMTPPPTSGAPHGVSRVLAEGAPASQVVKSGWPTTTVADAKVCSRRNGYSSWKESVAVFFASLVA